MRVFAVRALLTMRRRTRRCLSIRPAAARTFRMRTPKLLVACRAYTSLLPRIRGPDIRWVVRYQCAQTIPITLTHNHQFPDPCDILDGSEYRLELGKPDFSTILEEDEDDDVAEMGDGTTPSVSECNNAASNIAAENQSNTWTPPFAVSPFFCLPTTESTLAPPTPSETESGPSTPQYMPVLVYESASYEDALFTEFKAIIDWKAANNVE